MGPSFSTVVELRQALGAEGLHAFAVIGSGTELAVCHRLGRRCTGIDSSEVAINVARERLAPLEAQGDLFKTRETA